MISGDLPCVSANPSLPPSTPRVEEDSQDLLEDLLSNLTHLIVEVPLL